MDNRTEQLADGVWRIELTFWVNAFVLANDGHSDREGLTVVDTGTRGAGPRLVRSIRMMGFDPTAITDVLLTHWHNDHSGSAARLATSSAAPRVWVGEEDLPAVTGAAKPRDMVADASLVARFAHRYVVSGPTPVPGALALPDGHHHEAAGGTIAIAAPGHTIGHRVLHLPERDILIAGDAVMNLLRLRRGPGFFASARAQEISSLRRMAELDFSVLAPLHGPPITRDAKARLQALVGS